MNKILHSFPINLNSVVFKKTALLGFFIFSSYAAVMASEIADTADEFEAGDWSLTAYGLRYETEPVVESGGVNALQIPLSGGGTSTVFSQSSTDIEMEAVEESTVLLATFRPRNGLHYRFKIGQIRSYEVEFASGSLTNSFKALDPGILWGAGVRWNGTRDTMVSAAFALDLSYTRREIKFDRFQSGTSVYSAQHDFEQDELQAAVNISRRFKNVEPYGGLKFFRLISRLEDKATKQTIRGDTDGISPFLGVAFSLFRNEKIFIEGSLIDEAGFSAGVSMRL